MDVTSKYPGNGLVKEQPQFACVQVMYRTTDYYLDEIVFRKASETQIDGASAAMEAQLIHRHWQRADICISVLLCVF